LCKIPVADLTGTSSRISIDDQLIAQRPENGHSSDGQNRMASKAIDRPTRFIDTSELHFVFEFV